MALDTKQYEELCAELLKTAGSLLRMRHTLQDEQAKEDPLEVVCAKLRDTDALLAEALALLKGEQEAR